MSNPYYIPRTNPTAAALNALSQSIKEYLEAKKIKDAAKRQAEERRILLEIQKTQEARAAKTAARETATYEQEPVLARLRAESGVPASVAEALQRAGLGEVPRERAVEITQGGPLGLTGEPTGLAGVPVDMQNDPRFRNLVAAQEAEGRTYQGIQRQGALITKAAERQAKVEEKRAAEEAKQVAATRAQQFRDTQLRPIRDSIAAGDFEGARAGRDALSPELQPDATKLITAGEKTADRKRGEAGIASLRTLASTPIADTPAGRSAQVDAFEMFEGEVLAAGLPVPKPMQRIAANRRLDIVALDGDPVLLPFMMRYNELALEPQPVLNVMQRLAHLQGLPETKDGVAIKGADIFAGRRAALEDLVPLVLGPMRRANESDEDFITRMLSHVAEEQRAEVRPAVLRALMRKEGIDIPMPPEEKVAYGERLLTALETSQGHPFEAGMREVVKTYLVAGIDVRNLGGAKDEAVGAGIARVQEVSRLVGEGKATQADVDAALADLAVISGPAFEQMMITVRRQEDLRLKREQKAEIDLDKVDARVMRNKASIGDLARLRPELKLYIDSEGTGLKKITSLSPTQKLNDKKTLREDPKALLALWELLGSWQGAGHVLTGADLPWLGALIGEWDTSVIRERLKSNGVNVQERPPQAAPATGEPEAQAPFDLRGLQQRMRQTLPTLLANLQRYA